EKFTEPSAKSAKEPRSARGKTRWMISSTTDFPPLDRNLGWLRDAVCNLQH
ncbi:hypothetical protein HGM15179_001824, partial [Zosterops borbonicus]